MWKGPRAHPLLAIDNPMSDNPMPGTDATPESRFAAPVQSFDLHAEVAALRASAPAKHGHRQKALLKIGGHTIAIFVLDAGAQLPEHHAAGTVCIQPIEGEVVVTSQGRSQTLGPGHIQTLAPRVPHAVKADRQAAFLLHVSLVGA